MVWGHAIVVAQAQPSPIDESSQTPSSGDGWWLARTVVLLALVLGIAWWMLRNAVRTRGAKLSSARRMRVMDRLELEPRRTLHLVKVGESVLLVGTTEQGMSVLKEIPASEVQAMEEELRTREAPSTLREWITQFRGASGKQTDVNETAKSEETQAVKVRENE